MFLNKQKKNTDTIKITPKNKAVFTMFKLPISQCTSITTYHNKQSDKEFKLNNNITAYNFLKLDYFKLYYR